VRQWIVLTSIRSSDANIPEQQRNRYRRMLDTVFRMLNDMVPGFDIRFHSANSETFEVLLETSDGLVPIEFISQGMHSTIAWLGTVLQRLFDVYRDAEQPDKQPALMMIDEIDSHLSPASTRRRLIAQEVVVGAATPTSSLHSSAACTIPVFADNAAVEGTTSNRAGINRRLSNGL
jgi:hypothetical protein